MLSNYIKLVETRARQELEQLSAAQQRAIIEAYNSAGKDLVRKYRNAKDGTATKALYASYTQKLAEETQRIIEQYAVKGAQIAPSVEKLIMQQAFQMAGLDTSLANDKFENLIGKLGMESVKNIIGGKIYKDGVGLSARVWQASAMSSNKIQEVIAAGLAQDMGAAKLSKLLQDYVNPTARKNWSEDKIRELLGDGYAAWNKNLEYNALRLARTTLAHTATMSMRQAQKVNPYATKIRWHSVHAAGRTCSICEDMDGQVYDTDKCPFDHPNGMCYQTHEMEKSLNEMADELAAWCKGEPNEMLDEWWESVGGEVTPPKPSFIFKRYTSENSAELIDKHSDWSRAVTQEQRDVIRIYTGDSGKDKYTYRKWNNYLRGKERIGGATKKKIEVLKQVTQSCTTKDSFVAFRGMGIDTFEGILSDDLIKKVSWNGLKSLSSDEADNIVKSLTGMTFCDPAFVSTSVSPTKALSKSCKMEIQVPEGANCGAFISDFTWRNEDEFLIAPGTPMVFDSCKIVDGVLTISARLLVGG